MNTFPGIHKRDALSPLFPPPTSQQKKNVFTDVSNYMFAWHFVFVGVLFFFFFLFDASPSCQPPTLVRAMMDAVPARICVSSITTPLHPAPVRTWWSSRPTNNPALVSITIRRLSYFSSRDKWRRGRAGDQQLRRRHLIDITQCAVQFLLSSFFW